MRGKLQSKENILSKIYKTDTCWFWCGALINGGYGMIRWEGKARLAHRVVYEILKEKILDNLDLMHICDIPYCVNPDHVKPVTTLENIRDMYTKERDRACYTGSKKMTVKEVKEILRPYREKIEKSSIPGLPKRVADQIQVTEKCWNWIGTKNPNGYGQVDTKKYDGSSKEMAHRFVYRTLRSDIPKGLDLLHSCDNSACVNPDHLRPGTHAENMKEAGERNRMPKGSKHHKAKLSEQTVKFIQYLLASKNASQQKIANELKVSASTISAIVQGLNWKHIFVLKTPSYLGA